MGVGDPKPTWMEWRTTAIIGLFLIAASTGLVAWSQQWVPSGVTSLLMSTTPLFLIAIDALSKGKQKPRSTETWGAIIGFCGIAFLINTIYQDNSKFGNNLFGVIGLLIAALIWTIGSIYQREAAMPKSGILGTGMEMIIGGVLLILLSGISGELHNFSVASIKLQSWIALLYLLVMSSLVGYSLYIWLLRVAPTSLVATYAYVNPLIAVLIGHYLGQESMTIQTLFAGGMVIGSVLLISRTQPEPISTKDKVPARADQ
jgi:drug/metabolite transporter (DMT)-like permease